MPNAVEPGIFREWPTPPPGLGRRHPVAAPSDAAHHAVVLGEPGYYGRFGFQPAPGLGLSDAYGGGDAFQVIELLPGGIPVGAGLVRYAPEFALVA